MKTRRFCRILYFCFLSLIFVCCSDKFKTVHEQYLFVDKSDLKDDTLIADSVTKAFFSRLSRPSSFGRTLVYKLSKEQEGKEFYIVFYGKIRTNFAQSNATITVVEHTNKSEQICWLSLFLRRHFTDQNKWCYFKDSIRIEPSYMGKLGSSITCVAFLAGTQNEKFDLDTLHIAIKEKM